MFLIKPFLATGRRVARNPNALQEDPRIILLNTGVQLRASIVSEEDLSCEEILLSHLEWLRFKNFQVSTPLRTVLPSSPSLLRFRSYGHFKGLCRVSLVQSLLLPKKVNNNIRFDWKMSLTLFPWKPVLIYSDKGSVFAGKIESPQVFVSL